MIHAGSRPIAYDQLLFVSFLIVLVWAPLPFGSNRPYALALLAAVLSCQLAIWLILKGFQQVDVSKRIVTRAMWPTVILVMIPLWILLQLVPLPIELVAFLSPRAAELHGVADRAPLSLDVAATRIYFLNSIACVAGFVLALFLVNSERRARILLWALVLSGLFQAVYGGLMVLTGLEWGFFVEKYVGKSTATGTFINRNHLAGYLVMTLALGTGLLISQLSRQQVTSWREFAQGALRLVMSPKIFLRVFLALMVIALVLTRSRMGNSAFFISLAVAGIVAVLAGRKFSIKLAVLLLSLLVVDTWIVGQWFGLEKVVERLEQTSTTTEGRIKVSSDSLAIVKDFWLTGSGGGSFESIFTYYQGIDSPGRYDHAHNDYLEIASNLGVPALVMLIACSGFVLVRAIDLQRPSRTRLQQGVGFALVMVLVWLAMHSSVDFNLHIPANNLTLSVIFALAFVRLSPEKPMSNGQHLK